MANFTLAQLEDELGAPIVFLSFWIANQKRLVQVTLESLPPAAQTAIIQFINSHLP